MQSTRDRRDWALWGWLALAALVFFNGVWWGWPASFDQHDPTRKAIRMLWERSLDPGIRYWGAFAYQEVLALAVVPAALAKKLFGLSADSAIALSYLGTRLLWALKALLVVWLTYFATHALGQRRRAALLAMGAAVLAPGLVAWSHIPQVDMAHAFWYSVAVAATALAWRRRRLGWLWAAAVAAGLTAGVKYIGGVIVLAPAIAAFLLLPARRALVLALALMATAVGVFVITTPLATGDPLGWAVGYLADALANQHRELNHPLAFWTLPGAIWDLLGPATAILAILAAGIAVLVRGGQGQQAADRDPLVLMGAFLLPYYLVLSTQHVATVRYVLPMITPLAMAVGLLGDAALRRLPWPRLGWALVWAGVLAQSVLVLALSVGFQTDTRLAMARWMEERLQPQDQVETLLDHRPFFTAPTGFSVVSRPHFQAETAQMQAAVQADQSSMIRQLLETLAEASGHPVPPTWVDRERIWLARQAETFNTGVRGPWLRGSDYILINRNTARFYVLNWAGEDPESPGEREFYQSVINEQSGFRRIASFEPLVPAPLRYPRELWFNLSPPIDVYSVGEPAAGTGGP